MAASVSNIVRVDPTSPSTWLVDVAVAGADSPMPVSAGGFTGIDGAQTQSLENSDTALVAGNHYSAYVVFTGGPYDMSQDDQAIFIHFRNNAPFFTSISDDADAVQLALFSGTGQANYAIWNYPGNTGIKNGDWWLLLANGTPDSTGGTFVNTDVTGMAISVKSSNTDVFGFQMAIDQPLYINGPVVLEDDLTPGSVGLQDYFDIFEPESTSDFKNLAVVKAGPVFEFGFPISIQSDSYDDSSLSVGVAFKENDGVGFNNPNAGYFRLEYLSQASGTQSLDNAALSTVSSDFELQINGDAASSTQTINSTLVAGVSDVVLDGTNSTFNNVSIASPTNITIGDSLYNNLSVDDNTNPLLVSSAIQANSTVAVTNAQADALQFDLAPADYSTSTFTVDSGATINFNPTAAGTFSFDIESVGTVNFDNLTANDITVSVSPSLSVNVVSPTTGGGTITVDNAVSTTLTINGLVDGTEVRVFENGTTTELAGVENSTGGTFSTPIAATVSAVDINILSLTLQNIYFENISMAADVSLVVNQQSDRQYENP